MRAGWKDCHSPAAPRGPVGGFRTYRRRALGSKLRRGKIIVLGAPLSPRPDLTYATDHSRTCAVGTALSAAFRGRQGRHPDRRPSLRIYHRRQSFSDRVARLLAPGIPRQGALGDRAFQRYGVEHGALPRIAGKGEHSLRRSSAPNKGRSPHRRRICQQRLS
jgi:hypothetical protein